MEDLFVLRGPRRGLPDRSDRIEGLENAAQLVDDGRRRSGAVTSGREGRELPVAALAAPEIVAPFR